MGFDFSHYSEEFVSWRALLQDVGGGSCAHDGTRFNQPWITRGRATLGKVCHNTDGHMQIRERERKHRRVQIKTRSGMLLSCFWHQKETVRILVRAGAQFAAVNNPASVSETRGARICFPCCCLLKFSSTACLASFTEFDAGNSCGRSAGLQTVSPVESVIVLMMLISNLCRDWSCTSDRREARSKLR